MKTCRITTALLCAILPVACEFNSNAAEQQTKQETDEDVIVGLIAAVRTDEASAFRTELTVENAVSSRGLTYGTLIARLADTIPIYRFQPNGTLVPGGFEDLVVGAQVTVHHTGAVWRSAPPQVQATRLDVKAPA